MISFFSCGFYVACAAALPSATLRPVPHSVSRCHLADVLHSHTIIASPPTLVLLFRIASARADLPLMHMWQPSSVVVLFHVRCLWTVGCLHDNPCSFAKFSQHHPSTPSPKRWSTQQRRPGQPTKLTDCCCRRAVPCCRDRRRFVVAKGRSRSP